MILSIFEQMLPFLPLVFGLYISYHVLKIADLTTDGSFLLGAALFGLTLKAGFSPLYCLLPTCIGGLVIGIIISLLHTRLHPLICGILLVFIINTLTLKIMGKPNLSLIEYPTPFSFLFLFFFFLLLFCSISLFLSSKTGLMLSALGNNPSLFHLLGKSATLYRTIGLAIHSSCAAMSGALTSATNGFVDISMGTGVVLIALATLLLGQKISHYISLHHPFSTLLCACLGVFTYFFLLHVLLYMGLDPIYLRLTVGFCLTSFLLMSHKQPIYQEKSS